MDNENPLFKMNEVTFMTLEEILSYLNDGRVFLAREKLEFILGVDPQKEKA
jgi:Tfp pilus assembly protein PilF